MTNPSTSRRGRLIPWYFVMAFGVVFVVNGLFVYFALNSHSGVISEHAYEKGLDYNRTLEKSATQQALGWHATIQIENRTLHYQLNNKDGKPLNDAQAVAHFTYPIRDGYDFVLPLSATTQLGHYRATVQFPISGQWDIIVNSQWNQQQHQTHQRVVIP